MMKTIEEVHTGIALGTVGLEEFQAWLALWAVQIVGVLNEPLS